MIVSDDILMWAYGSWAFLCDSIRVLSSIYILRVSVCMCVWLFHTHAKYKLQVVYS